MTRRSPTWIAALLLAAGLGWPAPAIHGQTREGATTRAEDARVPDDLRPLLTPAPSELRFVLQYYDRDRATLNGNYATGEEPRRFRGRGGPGQEEPDEPRVDPVSLSVARIARLERFEMDWRRALDALDPSGFSDAGRADLAALRETIAANEAALEVEEQALREVLPLAPFGPDIVGLVEARMRIEEMDARAAAAAVTRITREVADVRSRLEAGLRGTTAAPLSTGPDVALRAAATVEGLQRDLAEWYGFYFGYDPLFTWWVELPYTHADTALTSYAAYLRDGGAPAEATSGWSSFGGPSIPPAPAPAFDAVPDLRTLVALPHDEMEDVVARFRSGLGGGGGRGRGEPRPEPEAAYYRDWLAALETLDFDALSRNAQVDWLYIRRVAELALEREGVALPANPPRKPDDSGIPGDARGREGLIRDLQDEFVSYTPEELIALAEKEFAWADAEMLKASRELGFGDDWKAAMDHVKGMHPPPGGQPIVIRDMLHEAVDYLREHDLLTVPQVATESLHMGMMSPERQLVNPFFTGGSRISVSYPTNTMEYEARLQSMRGNNGPFSHATAHHEMIPGHNLTGYVGSRTRGYRASLGGTPFYGEGWALYWELTLYDRGFNDTPEERIGALFWRMHRCARIIFSLKFHMGEWSPQEAVDFLVDRVDFEPDNARAEVLRSFQGGYGPLYQAAYLLGGLQLRGLHEELVASGRMTDKAFHDEVLRQGSMPIALIRLGLLDEALSPDMSLDWKFYGDLE